MAKKFKLDKSLLRNNIELVTRPLDGGKWYACATWRTPTATAVASEKEAAVNAALAELEKMVEEYVWKVEDEV